MSPMLCSALVGRDDEAARLHDALHASLQGHGGVTLVAGSAGIGKSRLVTAAAAEARARGATVLLGRAVPSEVPAPYRPLAEALVAASRSGLPPESTALRGFRAALGRLVPEWREDASDLPDESPVVVAEALVRVLRAQAGRTACVLVVEDLQWADPESLHAIEYLADHVTGLPVLCLGTLRDDPGTAAIEAASRLEARRAVDVIWLSPLAPDEVATMARDCLGASDLPAGVEALLREGAEGVPFFVEELLAAAAARGALVRAEHGWSVAGPMPRLVPQSFAETVRRRFAETGAEGRDTLGIAALLGRSFDWRMAARAAGCSPQATDALLSRAVALQLLAVRDGGFTFRHALTREAILHELLPTEQSDLAARALAALVEAPPGGGEWRHTAADLAELAGEGDRAAALLLAAARGSLGRGALATAAAALQRATRLVTDPGLRADVEEALAEALSAAGDVKGTQAAVAALLETLEGIGAPLARRGQAHLLVARSAVTATNFALASEELVRARRLSALAGDAALAARVSAVSAQLAIGEGRLGEAEALASRAVADAASTLQPEVVCEALEVAGRCARTRDLAEATALFTRALHVAEDEGLALWRLRALYQLGTVELFESGAVERLERARDLAMAQGALATAASLDLEIGAGLELQFCRGEALAAFERCIEMAALLGLRLLEAMAHVFVGVIHAGGGARRPMEDALGRALALADDDTEVVGAAWGDARAVASLVEEDRPRAVQELESAAGIYAGRSAIPRPALAMRALVTAVEGGEPDPGAGAGATAVLCQARAYLAYAEAVRHGREGRRTDAEAAAARGDAHLANAPWYRHLVRRLGAEAAIADGWGDPGAWLSEAAPFFEDAGSHRLASACRALVRRTGARVARPTHAARLLPAGLRAAGVTVREAEVLALVGQGLSNADIAGRLFLSERTVEHHIGGVRQKLSLESRAQMVAYALTLTSDAR